MSYEPLKVVNKPWGKEEWLSLNDKYCFKKITVNAGCGTSLQYHEKKRETTVIHSGECVVTYKKKDDAEPSIFQARAGCILDLEPGDIHRIEAITDVLMYETSTPEVDDVVRLKDSYGREGTSNP